MAPTISYGDLCLIKILARQEGYGGISFRRDGIGRLISRL